MKALRTLDSLFPRSGGEGRGEEVPNFESNRKCGLQIFRVLFRFSTRTVASSKIKFQIRRLPETPPQALPCGVAKQIHQSEFRNPQSEFRNAVRLSTLNHELSTH